MELGARLGACSLQLATWSLELKALELEAWSLEFGAWSLELGAWSLEIRYRSFKPDNAVGLGSLSLCFRIGIMLFPIEVLQTKCAFLQAMLNARYRILVEIGSKVKLDSSGKLSWV